MPRATPREIRWYVVGVVIALAVAVALPATVAWRSRPADAASPAPGITALALNVAGPAQFVRGSDGRVRVDYDLLLTNWLPGTVTVRSLEVLDGGTPLLRLTGSELAAVVHPVGDRAAADPRIAASTTSVVLVSVPLSDTALPDATVPSALTHRVSYDLPADLPPILRAVIDAPPTVSGTVPVDQRPPTRIAAPLRGSGWFSTSGCCRPSPHRNALVPVDGRWSTPETYAVDWIQVRGGRACTGDCGRLADWPYVGSPLLAVADGVVVDVRDDLPDHDPPLSGGPPANRAAFGGNVVTIRIAVGVYAYYAHLRRGSAQVRSGDVVRAGDVLGQLGNSGNTAGPHLHFQLMDGPDALVSRSLPFEIDSFTLVGDGVLKDDLSVSIRPDRRELTDAHPLVGSVVDLG